MSWSVETQHPVAVDSLDHLHPLGTIQDNNTNDAFVHKLNKLALREGWVSGGPPKECGRISYIPDRMPFVLDIGCAGGAFVRHLHYEDYNAIGIEGSDINQKTKRAEWATIPECLFTADATKPYAITRHGKPVIFDCITAWEVLEHIERADLPAFMENVVRHSRPGTLFICSVANSPSLHDGVDLHRTQEGPDFWLPFFTSHGFERDEALEEYFAPDFVRVTDYNWVFRKI